MQREAIIGLAILITLAVLAPHAPTVERAEATEAAFEVQDDAALHETAVVPEDVEHCLLRYEHTNDGSDASISVRFDVTI